MKLISEQELKELLIANDILERLEEENIFNWEVYKNALENEESFDLNHEDWKKFILPDLLNKYTDYTISSEFDYCLSSSDFDNYNYD